MHNTNETPRRHHHTSSITNREKEVLHLIAHEHSSKEIAEKLYVSYETIHSHRKNIMSKLGVRNTAGLIRVAFEQGLMRVGHMVCMFLLLYVSSHSAQAQLLTGLKYNYQVNFTKAAWHLDSDATSPEEPTWLIAACHDQDDAPTSLISNYTSTGSSSCGGQIHCRHIDAYCHEPGGCVGYWDFKILNRSNESDPAFDYHFRSWEDDGGARCSGDGDTYRATIAVLFQANSMAHKACSWSQDISIRATNSSDTWIKAAWRYHKGEKNNPIDFGAINPGSKWHINSNRPKPLGADNNIGYPNSWLTRSSSDVTYTFRIENTAKDVHISTAYTTTNFDTYLYLYEGSTLIAKDDDSGGNLRSRITRKLCPGTYTVVVEGTGSNNHGDFRLGIDATSIILNAGTIFSSQSEACEGATIQTITGSTVSSIDGVAPSYQWQEYVNGSWSNIQGQTGKNLSNYGNMGTSNKYFRRRVSICGVVANSLHHAISYINSSVDAGEIQFAGDTRTITSSDPEGFMLPNDASSAAIGTFSTLGSNGPSGSPGPITTVYQVKRPNNSEYEDQYTGSSWTPGSGNANPFTNDGIYKVRRKSTNSCGTSDTSDPITIYVRKVADLGKLSGTVRTPTGSPVEGVTITAVRTSAVEGGSYTTDTYETTTASDGTYSFNKLYFGADIESAAYTVTPSLTVENTVHTFDPSSSDKTIEPGLIINADFTDNTSIGITGLVYQSFESGNNHCGLDSVIILLDGLPKDTTTMGGMYDFSVPSPGNYEVTAQYKNQTFVLDYSGQLNEGKVVVQSNITDLNFESTTQRRFQGRLTDGCGASIGDATIKIQTLPNCTIYDVTTNNGHFDVMLPARRYKMFVENHDDPLVNTFFSAAQFIDLSEEDTLGYLLRYRAQPVVTISGLGEELECPGDYDGLPHLEQMGIYPYTIEVRELALKKDGIPQENTCLLDTGVVKIIDDISERDTVTLKVINGIVHDTIIAGSPNLIPPHLRKISMVAMDMIDNTPDSEPLEQDALVTGARSTAANFDLVTPELPMMILRDPPGDGSYSFVEQEEVHEVATTMYAQKSNSDNKWGNVRVGTQFEAGFIGFDVSTEIWADQSLGVVHGSRNTSSTEVVETTSVSSRFQTSSSDLIVGSDGDLIIGASMVMNYSTADIVSLNGCDVELSKELIVAPKGVKTQYFLRTGFIRDVTIPSLEYKVENPPHPDSVIFYKDQVKIWKNILEYNEQLKEEAVPYESISGGEEGSTIPENLTLSDNAMIEYRVTSSSSATLTTEFATEIDKETATELGLEIAGIGASGGVVVNMKTEKGEAKSTSTSSTYTVGFSLFDNDRGDGFNISIMSDPVFKTPVFVLNSGQTSCPWEPGTQRRDVPQLIAVDPIQANIPDQTTRTFNFELGNISETGEERAYKVEFVNESNTGARIEFSNVTNQEYTVAPGTNVPLQVNVSQFSNPSDAYSFEGLTFEATPVCKAEKNISDDALISAFFQSPCTDVTMQEPGDNWVINSGRTTIPIIINGYTKPGLTEIQLEYLEVGTYNWVNAMVIPASSLLDNDPLGPNLGTTVQFDAKNIPDGNYYLRLKAVCSGGINNYSVRVQGIKDTRAPALLTLPTPSDDIYDANDEIISALFDEDIKSINTSNATVEFIRLDNGNNNMGELPATLALADNRAIITPQQLLIGGSILPGAYRVILRGVEDAYGNVADDISWVFATPGYEKSDDPCLDLMIENNNNDYDAISVSEYSGLSISSTGNVLGAGETKFMASNEVVLMKDFSVSPGGEFTVDIHPCDEETCEDVTSTAGRADDEEQVLSWGIVDDGTCVTGVYFDDNTSGADIELEILSYTGTNNEMAEIELRMGYNIETVNLDATGARVSLGKYLSQSGILYAVEAVLEYTAGSDGSMTVIAVIELSILPPDTTAPTININPISTDDMIDTIEVKSHLSVSGTTNAEDGQEVTVKLNGVTYNSIAIDGLWEVTIDTAEVQALPSNTDLGVTADVSDLSGNAAIQATRTIVYNTNTPKALAISDIATYGTAPDSPLGEEFDKIVDGDVQTKFLNFNDSLEFVLDLGSAQMANYIQVVTANDEAGRDPKELHIAGSNDGVNFTALGSPINITCFTERHFTRTFTIENTASYRYYRVQFFNKCDDNANSLQLAEVRLLGN